MTINNKYQNLLFILLGSLIFLTYLFTLFRKLPDNKGLNESSGFLIEEENEEIKMPFKFNEVLRDSLMLNNRTCSTFKAFIYPLSSNFSIQAQNFHFHLLKSNYAIDKFDEACVFVAILDTADQVESLKFLNGNEDKHIVYLLNENFDANSSIQHYFSMDIIGQNSLLLNIDDNVTEFNSKESIKNGDKKPILQLHFDELPKLSLINGCDIKNSESTLKCFYSNSLDDIVQKTAQFTYIDYKNPLKFNAAFYSTLQSGSIPIISGFNYNKLPLSDFIEWERAVLRLPLNQLSSIFEVLDDLDKDQLVEMRRRTKFYFDNYFKDEKTLIRSTLSAIRYRMQIPAPIENFEKTQLARATIWPLNYEPKKPLNIQNPRAALQNANYVFNVDPTFLDIYSPYDHLWKMESKMFNLKAQNSHLLSAKRGMAYSESLSGNVPDEEFTIILQAYKRDNQLRHVLQKLQGIRFCRQIIVYWVDAGRKLPPTTFWPRLNVPIHFVLAEGKSINNRFLPFDLIETEAVFSMDDDFEVQNDFIEFSFRVWRENRNVLVGPNERLGYTDPHTKQGVYRLEFQIIVKKFGRE